MYWKVRNFCLKKSAKLCSLRSQYWQHETIQSDFQPLWSWQEKNVLFSALLLLVINRWCHKRKERLWGAWKIFLFTWVIFPVFVPTSAKANVGKKLLCKFSSYAHCLAKRRKKNKMGKKVKVDFKSFWKLARTARNL